jgi:hypothetical protein
VQLVLGCSVHNFFFNQFVLVPVHFAYSEMNLH